MTNACVMRRFQDSEFTMTHGEGEDKPQTIGKSQHKMAGSATQRNTGLPTSLTITVLSSLILLRILVGFQPHSGQDNYHGKQNAYGGDYEAQRHWMELTLHLPIGDWYWYDLEYWGLDYPPLTAYVSYICGVFSEILVGPQTVTLFESRGIEDPTHKAFMRGTVLMLDVLVYCSTVWFITRRTTEKHNKKSLWVVVMALSQPALILMDHGHFQYNTVSLGFALLSFHFMTKGKTTSENDSFLNCVIGSVCFCLALNFKQMALYYSPAIFSYLLGRCCAGSSEKFVRRFVSLGVTVIIIFVLHWWPFVWYPPSDVEATPLERVLHVLRRIFPFQRGLFEGKVSNLWCALSTKPISIRKRVPEELQPPLALATTLLLILPACYKLFEVGRSRDRRMSETLSGEKYRVVEYDWRWLLWGTTSTSLSFFLASFQVHEKSILMALAPASLLILEDSGFVNWFSVVCAWSLWPLIRVDRLEVAYVCTMAVFLTLTWLYKYGQDTETATSIFDKSTLTKFLPTLSFFAMIGLHVLEIFVKAPANLPDLFPVLWSIFGCGMFCVSWSVTCWYLLLADPKIGSTAKLKTN